MQIQRVLRKESVNNVPSVAALGRAIEDTASAVGEHNEVRWEDRSSIGFTGSSANRLPRTNDSAFEIFGA